MKWTSSLCTKKVFQERFTDVKVKPFWAVASREGGYGAIAPVIFEILPTVNSWLAPPIFEKVCILYSTPKTKQRVTPLIQVFDTTNAVFLLERIFFLSEKCERCLNTTWTWKSFQEWMGFLFSWTSKVILNIAAFIVFYCLHDCFKGFLCFSQKIMQRIFCDVFLEIIVYAQTKMLFDEWIDVWYSIHNASFRVESFAKRWIFQPAAENNEWCTQ